MARDNYRYRSQIILQILLVVYVRPPSCRPCCSKMAGMNWFDALCHAMSACATSGFSTKNASVAYFNPGHRYDSDLYDGCGGIHFGLIYATVTGKRNSIFRSEVTRWYLGMLLSSGGLLIAIASMPEPLPHAFGLVPATACSSSSQWSPPQGFATADSNTWTPVCGHHPDLRVDRLPVQAPRPAASDPATPFWPER